MTPDPAPVTARIDAFRASKAMFTAVALGVFDLLGEGPCAAGPLATRTGADARAIKRLLDACAALGFLRKQDGVYANEPVADIYLRRSSPQTLTGYILYSDRVLFPMWAHLDDAAREGAPRWAQNWPEERILQLLDRIRRRLPRGDWSARKDASSLRKSTPPPSARPGSPGSNGTAPERLSTACSRARNNRPSSYRAFQ